MDYGIVSELRLKLELALSWASGDFAGASLPAPVLRAAWVAGCAAILVAILMLAVIVLLRARLLRQQRIDRETTERWRPLIALCIDGVPRELPPLALQERETFLRLWNHFFESLRGTAGTRLVLLARELGMDAYAAELLARGNMRGRLLAALTLGHLRDRARLEDLRRLVTDHSSLLSLAAARASLEIDPGVALSWVMPIIAEREDWPLARVSTMLAEAGPERVTQPLADALERAAGGPRAAPRVARLQRLMEVAHAERMRPAVRRVLAGATDEQVIASCLNALVDPHDVGTVHAHSAHPSWVVRMAAARALGRLGGPDDRKLLVEMLSDRHWWVRYHAGEALVAMPFVDRDDLRKIRAMLPDRYAADMLGQVLAEHE